MRIITKGHFKSITEFHIFQQKKLGNGSFGVVKLAIHAATNKYYAIKIINIKDIPSQHEIKLIEREIKLHSEIHHPHITTLWDTIVDQKYLYIILDYAERGNLFYYQNTKNKFTQPEAFIFFIQTVKALEHLHYNNIIHRDIKPENLLIDQFWNLKICDFGWAAENINTKRTNVCGTYEYMAPQMIFNSQYDYKVDIWALGVLLYEMVHGCAPFKGSNVNEVKEKMLKASYHLSQNLSQGLKNLIVNLLKFDPNERLSIRQILNHRWIQRMQVLISSYLIGEKVYDPLSVHKYICEMPYEIYASNSPTDIYSHNIESEIDNKKKITHHKSLNSLPMNDLRKINSSEIILDNKQTKNININFSINNFSYLKENQMEVKKYISPGAYDLRKKKSPKRYKTQANSDTFMDSIFSPQKIGISKSKQKTKRSQKKTPTKSTIKFSKNRKTSREQKKQKSSHKKSIYIQDVVQNQQNQPSSNVMQKIAMNLKKHAIKQKPISSAHYEYSPRNIRQIKKIKSKDKSGNHDFTYI